MKLPNVKPKLKLTADGYSLDGLAMLRATVMNKHQPIARRAACLDCLPEHYRVRLPVHVDEARKAYLEFLK